MTYTTLYIKENEYKLRLTTRSLIALEKNLGCNPIQVFLAIDEGKLPKMTEMAIMLHAMLQPLHHGITIDKVYDLIDAYLEENDNMFELIPVFVEVFQNAGFLGNGNGEAEGGSDPN